MTEDARPAVRFELHAHTTASDGVLAPAELIERAARRGLAACAVTDHDTTRGHAEARARAAELGLEFIPGIEATCGLSGAEIHIVGLFVDDSDGALEARFTLLRAAREARMREMIEKLRGLGIALDEAAVMSDRAAVHGRPHIARALLAAGHVTSEQEAFDRYLAEGRPACAPKAFLPSEEGIAAIRAARGVAILAHPGRYRREPDIESLRAQGLQGIEVWYPSHDSAQVARYEAEASRLGLLATGGADFHYVAAGRADLGSVPMPERVLDDLRRAAGR